MKNEVDYEYSLFGSTMKTRKKSTFKLNLPKHKTELKKTLAIV
jgi:hypothetical protein